EPEPVQLPPDAGPTLVRFKELRQRASNGLDHDAARELVRELKAVGGDLKTLRLALTGRDRGPELAALLEALPKDEALRRADAALRHLHAGRVRATAASGPDPHVLLRPDRLPPDP